MKKRGIVIGLILFCIICIILVGFLLWSSEEKPMGVSGKSEITVLKNPPIASLPESKQQFTTTDISEKSLEQGIGFCDSLEIESLLKSCKDNYILSKAEEEKDYLLCEQLGDKELVDGCKGTIIILMVASAYNEESNSQDNEDIIPSNIDLCEELDNEQDKEMCYDPKEAIAKNYKKVAYKII